MISSTHLLAIHRAAAAAGIVLMTVEPFSPYSARVVVEDRIYTLYTPLRHDPNWSAYRWPDPRAVAHGNIVVVVTTIGRDAVDHAHADVVHDRRA